MGETVDSKKILSVRRLVLGLLALAVLGAGCAVPPSITATRYTDLAVDIYDLMQSRIAGGMRVLTEGTFFHPFTLIPFTETRACGLVGDEVTKFLSGEAPSGIPEVYVIRKGPTQIESHDTIAVFLDVFGDKYSRVGDEYSRAKEKKFVGCITEAIRETHPAVRIVPPDEYRQAAFPGLAPDDIKPMPMGDLSFVDDPGFKGRIAPLGIRYPIRVSGSTRARQRRLGR